jgi:hypothetical protein
VELFEEHWPLLELRRAHLGDTSEAPLPLPPTLPHAQWWAFVRKPGGIGQLALEPREAELLLLLRRLPVGEALARLEANCPESEKANLPEKARTWLARSVELDMWSGLEQPSTESNGFEAGGSQGTT